MRILGIKRIVTTSLSPAVPSSLNPDIEKHPSH